MDWPESANRLINIIRRGVGDPWLGAFLWVGAGMSIPAGYPSLGQLAERLRKASPEKLDEDLDPLQTIDAFVKANGKGELQRALADVFTQKRPMPYHTELVKLPWKGIITTNYDELLEDALKQIDRKYIKVTLDQNIDLTERPEISLYKVHGDVAEFKTIVLDGDSYNAFNRRYPFLRADLESHLRKNSIVFFGCSMTDTRLLGWLKGLGRGGRTSLMSSCAVMTEADWRKIPEADRELLEEGNIKPILLEDHGQIPDLISFLLKEVQPEPSAEELSFKISFASDKHDQWRIETDAGGRTVDVPWKGNNAFGLSLIEFTRMADERVVDEKARAELHSCAVTIGEALGAILLADADRQKIKDAAGQSAPLMTIESDYDLILSLPWELLRMDGEFLLREGRIDLVRSTAAIQKHPPTLPPADRYLKLVVNVSAPQGPTVGHLDCEAESYRIVRALHDYSQIIFTELGGAEEMVKAIADNDPVGVHFSGHGAPGKLLFEDNEGMENPVTIRELLRMIRIQTEGKLPLFFYLASCHGNTPANLGDEEAGSSISAAQLHREGVVQVIGYYGPIVDELSTLAEVAVYRELAAGRSARHGVRLARAALSKGPDALAKGVHRGEAAKEKVAVFPFAWAQLVFYHRGPDYPLSLKLPEKYAQEQEARLQRSFTGTEQRRILSTGFIGRRRELHRFRRALRGGQRVFVFQGLGGLGKSALAFRCLPMLARGNPTLTVWCHEIEDAGDQARELTNLLSGFGRELFGQGWIEFVGTVDRIPDAPESQRFNIFLQAILSSVSGLTIYLDNVESLLTGPDNDDPDAFGSWQSPEVGRIWDVLKEMSGHKLAVMTSCRYRNQAFTEHIIPVPEMTDSAIFRMMGWFDGLRRLSVVNRARLVNRLHGHPRAVEFLEDLIIKAIRDWEDRRGQWVTPTAGDDIQREWDGLIAPALPEVEERLRQDLLLEAIWENVLDDRCRRMLFRMSLLRRPWDWDLMMQLGEPDEDTAENTAKRLRETSLLEQVEERRRAGWVHLHQIHPMTARFIADQFDEEDAEELRLEAYRRVGTYLEKLAKTSQDIRVDLDAGHYLFGCGEYDRANELLGWASQTLQGWGMVRQGIAVLEPFEQPEAMESMSPELTGRMLGTLGLAYAGLGQVEKAIEYYGQTLEIQKKIGDRRGEENTIGNLGLAYADLGQVEKAIEYYGQALEIAGEIGDRRGEGNQLGNLGLAYADLGQVKKAIEHYQQALEIAGEIGDRRGEGNSLGNLGTAYHRLGQFEMAIEYHRQALEIARETGDRVGEGGVLGNLGAAYYALGQVEKAIEYHQQALEIAKEIGDRRGEGSELGNLGVIYADLGQVEKAIEYHQQALETAKEIGDKRGEGNALGNLGLAYAHLGQVEKAREYLQAALAIVQEIKDPRMEAFVRENLEKLESL